MLYCFFLFQYEEPPKWSNLSSAVLPCLNVTQFLQIFFRIYAKVDSSLPRALFIISSTLLSAASKDPLEVDTAQFGRCIAGVTRMMFGFMRKTKRKMVVVEAFVMFFPVTIELNGVS